MSNIKTGKKIILITLGILLILSLLVGASYAYYIVTHSQTNSNIVKSTCISLSLTNEQNDISLDKQYPISDEAGKALTPYSFTITNTCRNAISYNLNLEMLEGTTLNSKYVKTMLNDNIVNLASLDTTDTSITTSTESRTLTKGALASEESINYEFRMWMDSNTEADTNSMNKEFLAKIVVTGVPTKTYNFDYTGAVQTFTVPQSGTYKIETWGASGNDKASWNTGDSSSIVENSYGLGGYTTGKIVLNKDVKLYVYVGGKNSYNGGGLGEAQGGGATDIRTTENNLYSRIIVAGGGGGGLFEGKAISTLVQRGSAGGLDGYDADAIVNKSASSSGATTGFSGFGASQYAGGKTGTIGYFDYVSSMDGSFGKGGEHLDSTSAPKYTSSGGGGGWYGGGHGRHPGGTWPGGGGGSSYISGHPGCLAVSSSTSTDLKNGCTENSTSLECSISYTGYYFTDTVMIDGDGYKWTTEKGAYTGMPSHDGTGTITGNSGNGYARITYIG